MRTLLWSYLGWRRFPRDMSAFEVRHFFSFSVADRRELRVRYPRRLRLGAALQVGFVRMTGTTLDSFDYVPNAVLKHVARTLALPAGYRDFACLVSTRESNVCASSLGMEICWFPLG
jgi:hypothetical protein